jgi:hypothetical protein
MNVSGMILGSLLQAYGAKKGYNTMKGTMENVKESLADWKTSLGEYKTQADSYMDRNSDINRGMRTDIRQNAMDAAAQAERLRQRQSAGAGMSSYTGLANQNLQSTLQSVLGQSEEVYGKQLGANRAFGTSILDSYIKNQRAYGETMAQGNIQNDAMRSNLLMKGFSGLGSGIFDWAKGAA